MKEVFFDQHDPRPRLKMKGLMPTWGRESVSGVIHSLVLHEESVMGDLILVLRSRLRRSGVESRQCS